MKSRPTRPGKNPDSGGRWGILGGLFDPIHRGHISLAQSLVVAERLEGVLFLPAAHPPHKANESQAPFDLRLRMLKLALEHEPGLIPCDIEHRQNLSGYTLDSVRAIKKRYPKSQFCFIIGADNLDDIKNWYRYQEIFTEVPVIAGSRGGIKPQEQSSDPELPVKFVAGEPVTAASTEIRRLLAEGAALETMIKYLPEIVARYIFDQKLYI